MSIKDVTLRVECTKKYQRYKRQSINNKIIRAEIHPALIAQLSLPSEFFIGKTPVKD